MQQEFKTETKFELPRGYIDEEGNLHRIGTMRMATARDEIYAQGNPLGVHNDAKMVVRLLARVIHKIGSITVDEHLIENLFSVDYAYLQDLYMRLNSTELPSIEINCPECGHQFHQEMAPGEL